jgi:hypothetical protein
MGMCLNKGADINLWAMVFVVSFRYLVGVWAVPTPPCLHEST